MNTTTPAHRHVDTRRTFALWQVANIVSGIDVHPYTPERLDAILRAAGYRDMAHAREVMGMVMAEGDAT